MKKTKIYKSILLIFCLAMIMSFNLTFVFATEPNLNQPSDPSSEVSQKTPESQNNEQNQSDMNKQSTYKKSTSVKANNPSQQSSVSNVNNSSQNFQQNSNENQNGVNTGQLQQNTEKKEDPKKEKKEKSKSAGEFLATYPEKFNWEKIKEIEKSDENAENLEEDKDNKPKDLPDVTDEEIVLPEVMAVTETKNESSVSLFAGVVAWSCILVGIGIILFVLFMNKNSGEFPVDSEKSKKKRKSSTAKYYKGNF